ncbi:gamma-glutamylputrescine oxidase [Jannaschia pagri]|uniref:Gamma-glutamylputrescine oxidase n=1 Tax=Jannaschia pagri TaxID=2829797 RepID=A0ABQ4NHF4_9RHOB|nr:MULTISPECIES: FAD-binding oxidoreductase [unclassified Jannaschia]GIT90031.1 gamma-glutamylputrescine oxidase [Jannaschia sp. AI_61]GIT93863.1 gamma-glutamylputrescine oxidase [Jannaschia sp. AI_62]
MSWLHANGDDGTWPRTWYADGLALPAPYAPLVGAATADLCVIGAGITGLSAALHAAEAGMSVIVLDAQRVGWGASGRNGGQVGSGFNWDQDRLEARLGPKAARALWTVAEEAKSLTKRLIHAHAPAADLRPGILSAVRTEAELAGYAEWAEGMNRDYGTAYTALDRSDLEHRIGTTAYAGGILDPSAGYCNPLAYTLGLARAAAAAGVRIHEGSEVTRIGDRVETAAGAVTARFTLLATNGYAPHLLAKTAARVLPINNYIAVTAPLKTPPFDPSLEPPAVADSRFVVNYFWQTRDGRLVYGGGESYGRRFPSDIAGRVRRNLRRVYPHLADVAFSHAWGGTLAVTATRLPYVAEVAPGVFSAGGYSGHGLALSALCGATCVDAMRGQRDRFDVLRTLPVPALPGGRWLGPLGAQAGMLLGAVADRLRP